MIKVVHTVKDAFRRFGDYIYKDLSPEYSGLGCSSNVNEDFIRLRMIPEVHSCWVLEETRHGIS